MSRICVKNVGKNVHESQLRDLFSQRGEVTDVKLLKTKDGKSRKIAFVGFRTDVQAQEAAKYFNNTFVGLSKISVDIAKKVNDQSLVEAKLKHQKKPLSQPEKATGDSSKSRPKVNAPEVMSKKKSEFMEVMKARGSGTSMLNDVGVDGSAKTARKSAGSDSEGDDDSDDGSDGEEEDVNDFGAVPDASEPAPAAAASATMSDADYLKSRRAAFVDSDDEEEDGSEGDESDGKQPKAAAAAAAASKSKHDAAPAAKKEVKVVSAEEAEMDVVGSVEPDADDLADSARLFIKNLPFSCTEEEFTSLLSPFGVISEVHLPLDKERKGKGFGFVQFMIPENATAAMEDLAGTSFQGRLLHITKAHKKLEAAAPTAGDNRRGLSSFQLKKEEERRKFASKQEGWNAAFVRSDAVVESLADKYNISRSEILDTSEGGGELAVRLAIGESQVIAENREYFLAHGVDISALESAHSDKKAAKRSATTLLVKNLPFDLVEDEVESMFARFGALAAFLVPKSRTLALVDFVEPSEARLAYKGLAYRSYKHQPMYLEWAPLGAVDKDKAAAARAALQSAQSREKGKEQAAKKAAERTAAAAAGAPAEVDNQDEYSTLFIKNLNFITTEADLREHFANMHVQGIRTISIQKKQKGNQVLSQGYGFVEFRNQACAQEAMLKLDGALIDSHALVVKPSDKRLTIQPVSAKKASAAAAAAAPNGGNNKLIVRNVAFQATPQELRSLFAAFGSVKRVRIPKKMGGDHRGFAFVDFSTAQEAATAMASLKDTHLYGRHLVLEWAKEEDEDDAVMAGVSNSKSLEGLRKRARVDEKVIAADHKRSKSKKTIDDDDIDGGIGNDHI